LRKEGRKGGREEVRKAGRQKERPLWNLRPDAEIRSERSLPKGNQNALERKGRKERKERGGGKNGRK
jgi:hypothetical protein